MFFPQRWLMRQWRGYLRLRGCCVSTGGDSSSERRDVSMPHERARPVSEQDHILMWLPGPAVAQGWI